MASLLDLELLGFFGSIFVFILVWVVIYGLLSYIKAFGGDKKGLHGIIALCAAVLVLLSKSVLSFVIFVVPWYLVLAVVLFLFIFVFKIFGFDDKTIVAGGKDAKMWIIVIGIVILIFGFGAAFGQQSLEKGTDGDGDNLQVGEETPPPDVGPGEESTDTDSFSANVYNTIFHPKVLGLLLLFVIGAIVLVFLTSN